MRKFERNQAETPKNNTVNVRFVGIDPKKVIGESNPTSDSKNIVVPKHILDKLSEEEKAKVLRYNQS